MVVVPVPNKPSRFRGRKATMKKNVVVVVVVEAGVGVGGGEGV